MTKAVFAASTTRQLSNIDLKDDADNVRYDAAQKRIYVGFGSGGIAIVNSENGREIGAIKLSAHPEAFEVEKNGSRIFVNVPGSGCVEVIDRAKGEVIAKWKTNGAFANFPMAFDEENHRLFVGCRQPSELVVLNTNSGEAVTTVGISSDADEIFYDRKRRRIYAICGEGKIDVIQQTDANTYKSVAKLETAKGARTGLFLEDRDRLFVAVPHNGSQPAEVRVYQIE
jgi:DNA-binding beta-propeller fold protein YncE